MSSESASSSHFSLSDGTRVVDVDGFPVRVPSSGSLAELQADAHPELREQHRRYYRYNQTVPDTQPLYVTEGHPDSVAWIRLRAFFEQLVFAANSGARFYSYESPTEATEYWSPKLGVRNVPQWAVPREWEEHEKYISSRELQDHNTYLSHGSWAIRTRSDALFEAFYDGQSSGDYCVNVRQSYRESEHCNINWESGDYFQFSVSPNSVAAVKETKSIIDGHHTPLREAQIPPYSGTQFARRYLDPDIHAEGEWP